ncbi:MAG: hypothetical protein ACRDJW_04095 [Thermomicrobiales bacterium]
MPTIDEVEAWMAERSAKDRHLYERYGRPLEAEHTGEFVAISDDGEFMLDAEELTLTKEAVERFGPGKFALRKIGVDGVWRMRMFAA